MVLYECFLKNVYWKNFQKLMENIIYKYKKLEIINLSISITRKNLLVTIQLVEILVEEVLEHSETT